MTLKRCDEGDTAFFDPDQIARDGKPRLLVRSKEAPGHCIRGVAAAEQALPVLDPALANLAAQAIRMRKGQGIGLTLDGHEAAYIVRAGALMLQVAAGATPAKSLPFCFLATCSEVAPFRPTPRRA